MRYEQPHTHVAELLTWVYLTMTPAPVAELGFIPASGGDTDAFSEFQGFIAEFGCVLFTGRFAGDAGFVMSNHLLFERLPT